MYKWRFFDRSSQWQTLSFLNCNLLIQKVLSLTWMIRIWYSYMVVTTMFSVRCWTLVSNFLSLWTTTTSCLIIFKGIMYIILFLLMCMILILDVYDFLYSLGHIKNREFNWLIFGTHTKMDHLVLLNEVLSWRKYNVSMEWNF